MKEILKQRKAETDDSAVGNEIIILIEWLFWNFYAIISVNWYFIFLIIEFDINLFQILNCKPPDIWTNGVCCRRKLSNSSNRNIRKINCEWISTGEQIEEQLIGVTDDYYRCSSLLITMRLNAKDNVIFNIKRLINTKAK
jgi:hypothetical protein